jgi:hypothetical protein
MGCLRGAPPSLKWMDFDETILEAKSERRIELPSEVVSRLLPKLNGSIG